MVAAHAPAVSVVSSPNDRHDAQAQNVSPEQDCMTAREVASWLRVERKTVYEYASKRMIPCQRLGRRIVFHRAALVAWLAGSSTGTPISTPGPRR